MKKTCVRCGEEIDFLRQGEPLGDGEEGGFCISCRTKVLGLISADKVFGGSVSAGRVYLQERKDKFSKKNMDNVYSYLWECLNKKEERIAREKKEKEEKAFATANASTQSNALYLDTAIAQLRKNGAEGYYEYSVKSIIDEGGRTNIQKLTDLLNQMGLAGWKLATTHTNELGKNALMAIGLGINSTVDETILIFERFVKI